MHEAGTCSCPKTATHYAAQDVGIDRLLKYLGIILSTYLRIGADKELVVQPHTLKSSRANVRLQGGRYLSMGITKLNPLFFLFSFFLEKELPEILRMIRTDIRKHQ